MERQIEVNPFDQKSLNALMDQYGDSTTMFPGTNENGETVHISIFYDKIVVVTLQENGWVRKNIYYRDGTREETFDGKWA